MSNFVEQIRSAGVIGCGGAGFPTHVKLRGAIEHLIINGLECEPLLSADKYVMRHFAEELVVNASTLANEIGATKCTIALKSNYTEEITALEVAIKKTGINVAIHQSDSYYPAGDEQMVVYDVTGRVVPPGNIPLAVGCAVMNVCTLLAAVKAVSGENFTRRYLTVAGAVKNPVVVNAPIGAPFSECVAAAGGVTKDESKLCIVSGGPMMGARYEYGQLDKLYVEKTTSGILILPTEQYASKPLELERVSRSAKAACIQCSYCTETCPRYLLGHPLEPHKIMRKLAYSKLDEVLEDEIIRSAKLCCECGVCEVYACPMQLRPRSVNSIIKRELSKRGIRGISHEVSPLVNPMRNSRKIPTHRAAVRAGVGDYYGEKIRELKTINSDYVRISLKQGIGVASIPIVATSEIVLENQLIAFCPPESLGSDIHAPISGRVTIYESYIEIER